MPAGCPIRVPADQRPLAPTRGFSQLAAPFVACGSLGIHHAPFSTSYARGTFPAPRPVCLPFLFQYVNDLARGDTAGIVENNGLEPLTPCLQGRRSSQLS